MARDWTEEQKARQSALIHNWKPWTRSTGAKTPKGKAVSAKNAYRGNWRLHVRFSCWVIRQRKLLLANRPCASIVKIQFREKQFGMDLPSVCGNMKTIKSAERTINN